MIKYFIVKLYDFRLPETYECQLGEMSYVELFVNASSG